MVVTSTASFAATRPTGNMNRKKNRESMAKPFTARVCVSLAFILLLEGMVTYNNAVVPRKYSKLVKPRDQIPTRCGIASYENTKGEHRERVH